MAMLLSAVAAFATIISIGLPYLSQDTLASRMKYVASERDALRSKLRAEMANQGVCWPVTDFITLGSPLTYARFLLATGDAELRRAIADREFPTCPPEPERVDEECAFTFGDPPRTLHHASAFALTRWTNLYFKPKAVIFGDVIAGPLGGVFGEGIKDVEVTTKQRGGFLTHTLYWRPSGANSVECDPHIDALREAVRLAN